METVILSIEVTIEMDEALEECAKDHMVPKQDIIRGVLAAEFSKAKNRKPGFLGFNQEQMSALITNIASAFAHAIGTSKKEEAAEKGAV